MGPLADLRCVACPVDARFFAAILFVASASPAAGGEHAELGRERRVLPWRL